MMGNTCDRVAEGREGGSEVGYGRGIVKSLYNCLCLTPPN